MPSVEQVQKLEQEVAELRVANDELYRQHADEKALMQAAMEQDRLRADELAQTAEAYSVENGQWRESYAALEEAARVTEGRLEGEKRELEETIGHLEESVESYKAQVSSDLSELERERASNEAHERQEVELQRQIDERDGRFVQLTAEYDSLQRAYEQLEQAQENAQRAHNEEQAVKQQELAASGREIEELQAQVAVLESQIRALNADGEVKEVNQNALLRRAEENAAAKQGELDQANERVKALEDELALLSVAGPGSNEYVARLRNLQQEVFLKSEQLVQQGEKQLRVAEMLETTKAQLSRLREEVRSVRRVLLRGIGLDADTQEDDDEVDNAPYKHVKLSELVRLRLKAQEHEWQLAGGTSDSVIPTEASGVANVASKDQTQSDSDAPSCHLSNVDNFSALDALGLGGVGRLEREMRVLRSRNKRMTERTERLESELEAAQSGLRDLQTMREKVVEMAGRERVEKDLRTKSEQTCKELGDKVAALSEHIEKLMVHLKHEAAAKTRAVDAQKRLEKELGDTKDRLSSANRKNTAKDAQVAELEQGARILEDQLRLMDEKFIDVRNKLDYTRSAAQKESRQLNSELRALRMKWQLASDAGAFAGLPDWAGGASLSLSPVVGTRSSGSKLSKKNGKKSLGASSSDSRLLTGGNNRSSGLSPVVAAVVDDALAMSDGKCTRFEIPRLPQPEADAGTPWSDAKLSGLQRQLQSKHRV